MSSESPDRLKEIFAQAVQKESAGERERYLAEACRGQPELRREVESLLRANERAGEFLEQTVPMPASNFVLESIGTTIGRYKLLERIGEGGFGVVYLAEQQEPVKRKVALKVIKAGMDTKEVIARFEAERQALALMDHPNIAKVLDGGATEAGRPYFVMELVRGIPITDYCDQNNLSTGERLQLFIKVCHAVQHAHQKAVIHRDLKPSNILITLHDGEPVPNVIDFGVAKALGQKLTEKTLITACRQMIGTPAYMSPEQAEMSGLDVDTRSDIYSLGVLLYELLTGVTPFDKEILAKAAFEEIRRMIRETEPPKPSTRLRTLGEKLTEVAKHRHAEPTALSRLVRGDLDWIVMRCLEKDRSRRYATANGLAMDIARHLNHEPISAAAPSALYLAKKFIARHKAGLATTIGLFLLIASGAVATTLEAIRARRAERTQSSLRTRAEGAEQEMKQKLWASYLSEARAYRWSGQPGRRFNALEVLAKAAAIRPSLELRNEAIASMALADLRLAKEWECGDDTTMWAFDEANERYAQCATNGEISVRLVANDQEIARLSGPGKPAWLLRFSPDGKLLAARYDAGYIQLWDLARGEAVLRGPFGPLAFSQDSRQLAISEGPSLVVFGLESGSKRCFGLQFMADDLAFHPDGHRLALACDRSEPAVHVFSLNTGDVLLTLPHPAGVKAIAWNPTGTLLASACNDYNVYVWDLAVPDKPSAILKGHRGEATGVAFMHNEGLLASISWDQTVRLWSSLTGSFLVSDFGAPTVGFPQVQFSRDDRLLSFAAKGRTVGLWETATGRECRSLRWKSSVSKAAWTLAFSPDGHVLASGHHEGVRLWDTLTGQEVAFLPIGYTRTVLFDAAGRNLLTCREAEGVHQWPLAWGHTGSTLTLRVGPPEIVELPAGTQPEMISVAADGKTLAVADRAHAQVVLLDLENPAQRRTIAADPGIVEVAMSADSRWIVSGNWGDPPRRIRVTDSRTGWIALQTNSSGQIAFSPDCRWLAADRGGECCIWDVNTWEATHRFPKDSAGTLMTFSPDGAIFALAQSPQQVKLLATAHNWEEIASLDASEPIRCPPACFSLDGCLLAMASDNELIRLWDLRSIRSQLALLGLDWDLPPLPKAALSVPPIQVSVELGQKGVAIQENQPREGVRNIQGFIIPREPAARPSQIDLSRYYNALLTNTWHSGKLENSLTTLPEGLRSFVGVEFDVRGIVQLSGPAFDSGRFPRSVEGIPIKLSCRRVHFLQAAQWHEPDGTRIGHYEFHYADGTAIEIPLVYGANIRDWWGRPNEAPLLRNLKVAWSGSTEESRSIGDTTRIFEWTWENPRPQTPIVTLDLQSAMTDCSPFLIAITVEP